MKPSFDQLYAEAKQRADELETLFSIQQAITSRLDADAIMQLITEATLRLTRVLFRSTLRTTPPSLRSQPFVAGG